ncbi:MAG: hypothetical protein Q7T81_00300 [Pseudolabrys sp.]|nr:hypothetical protein [Pseudolabrys sp.]
MTRLSKTLTALAAVATLTFAAVASPQQAEARGRGGNVAAGIIGGLAAGAIIGGIASNGHGYGYGGYYGGPAYAYGPRPVYYGPRCWWQRDRVWDGYGWRMRRVRVCD